MPSVICLSWVLQRCKKNNACIHDIEVEMKPYKWNEMQRELMAPELRGKVGLGENRVCGLRTFHTNILIKANTICNEYTEQNMFYSI